MIYVAECRITGCPNSFVKIKLESEEFPINVICGPCGNEITDITEIIPIAE